MTDYYVPALSQLIDHFESLPSIGHKTAQRLAFYVLSLPQERAQSFADSILHAKSAVRCCDVCQNLTDSDVCHICSSPKRDNGIICVVEGPKDVISMEKTGEFNGLYHVLHGVVSPMDGISADDIRVKELLPRLNGNVSEVIMATNSGVEGEATAIYIARLIKPMGVKVTRIAQGIPIGADLEFTDKITLG
ncbi:MAG: recombination mediator RecR, partial [Clostridiales bacterium]|nr:recombination mediator RecR [Clostridiales bacterium]